MIIKTNNLFFEIGLPERIICDSKEKFLNIVNKYNGLKNIYRTVYNFRKLTVDKKIDYNSVLIDKMFFDFDGKNAFEETLKIHDFLSKKDILHTVRFSGKGFHVYIFLRLVENLQNPKAVLTNMFNYVEKKLNFNINYDFHVKGDISRLSRVLNTMNLKSKLFCISLKEEDLENLDRIRELAKKPRNEEYFFGKKLLEFPSYVYNVNEDYTMNQYFNNNSLIIKYDSSIEEKNEIFSFLPPCLKQLLQENRDLRWHERFWLIVFLKEYGFSLDETINVLKNVLSEKKFFHCVKEEKQPFYLYRREDNFPCKTIKKCARCPLNNDELCKEIKKMYYFVK